MKFDLQNILEKIGQKITNELRDLMRQQKGVDGKSYRSLASSTLKAKARRNDIPGENKTKRMLSTRDFVQNAYKFEAFPDNLHVKISTAQHGRALKMMRTTLAKYQAMGHKKTMRQVSKVAKLSKREPTYKQITEWQIPTGSSTFFPQDEAQVWKLESVRRGKIDFDKAAAVQASRQMKLNIKAILQLG